MMQKIELVLQQPANKQICGYLANEARVYERTILHRFDQMGFIEHRWIWRIFRVTTTVKFERVVVTDYQVYYKVKLFKRGPFDLYVIPYEVKIKDLVSKDTLTDLSASLQRYVTTHCDQWGLWFIVHRRDSPGADEETYKPYLDRMPI